ncbi:MAG TPA: N-acetylglucosamine-6-phosphate deacetylase [Chitinophagaceae bacterium]
MTTRAYIADRIFTGDEWLHFYAMIVEDGTIRQLMPATCLPSDIEREEFEDCVIAPAFIDLQIYGAFGRLFSVYPEPESLNKLSEYCEEGGAAYFLPTVATNSADVVWKCIDAVKAYWEMGGQSVPGLHLEGPWINPQKRGAHIEQLIHAPTVDEVAALLAYGKGIVKMITLAPEVCSDEIIGMLLANNIIISAGHSNATYKQAMQGFQNGITTVTHLYNAMSALQHREPGLVGASMDHPSVMASIIPDGYHVDYAAIRIAKQTMQHRLFAITDAVTDTAKGAYQHYPAGDKFESAGILSGSALTMQKALKNLVDHAGIDLEEGFRMCSLYPAQVLRCDHEIGKIKKDYKAKLVVLDSELKVKKVVR